MSTATTPNPQAKMIEDLRSNIHVMQTKAQVSNQVLSEVINANIELRTANTLMSGQVQDLQTKLNAATNTITQLSAKVSQPLPADAGAPRDVSTPVESAAPLAPGEAVEIPPAA